MESKKKTSKTKVRGISLRSLSWGLAGAAFLVSTLLIGSLFLIADKYSSVRESTSDYIEWKETALDVQRASDLLTTEVHYFVETKDKEHVAHYFQEVNVSKTRENALEEFAVKLEGTDIYSKLEDAVKASVKLMDDEFYSMRLIVESIHDDITTYPAQIQEVRLADADYALDDAGKETKARELVFGDAYVIKKLAISDNVTYSIAGLDEMMKSNVNKSTEELKTIVVGQQVLIGLNVAFIISLILLMIIYVVHPVRIAVDKLLSGRPVEVKGIKEYRYLADTYNRVLEQNIQNKANLVYQAQHDQLTGLYNRTGYDLIYHKTKLEQTIYILLDIDKFKNINDTRGHEVGDKVLIRVGKVLRKHFENATDNVFRIGGDEFSIIINNISNETPEQLTNVCQEVNEELQKETKTVPSVTLSIGVAFGENGDSTDSLFRKADLALYNTKRNGRASVTIYTKDIVKE